ncbi:MAG: cell division protein ZapA [Dysgonamonadaceae bacterium]|jgi:cell division protein ZapA|nr:cell division protein ZapA [Dysgonamonadaceae bacterium]
MKTKIINDEQLQIEELTINGKKLPTLIIKRSEEEFFRKAEKLLNKMIIQMHAKFEKNPEWEIQDFLVMIALQAIAETFTLEERNDTKPYDVKIQKMIDELDDYEKKYGIKMG